MARIFIFLLSSMLALTGCVEGNSMEGEYSQSEVVNPDEKQHENDDRMAVEFVETVSGDTIKVKRRNKTEIVRLLLIDTPSMDHHQFGEQPYAMNAFFATDLRASRAVELTLKFDGKERDEDGRLLAYVYEDGQSIQRMLLEKGLARVDTSFESDLYLEDYKKIEEQAKEKQIGIWQCPGYVTKEGFNSEKWCKEE